MQTNQMNRRQFIQRGAFAAGGVVLACSGLAAAGLYSKPVEFPESLATGAESSKVLVAYASKYGSTAGVAREIARILAEQGKPVDLLPAGEVSTLAEYQTVVLGSAIRMRKWMPEASDFVSRFQKDLADKNAAFFTVCLTMVEDNEESREKVRGFTQPVRDLFTPDREEFFAGQLDYQRLSLVEGALMKYAIKSPEGDFRDWDKISAWAEELAV